jgi:RHS repeat-associated protein
MYLNTTGSWITKSFQYDTYGNLTGEIDPNGNLTSTVYDNDYHVFPVTQSNALGQTSMVEYDNLFYRPVKATDPNGNIKTTEYDTLHRITKINFPGNDNNYKQLVYVDTGVVGSQYLEIRYNNDSSEGYNYVRHYYDGLMRLYKKTAKATILKEDSTTIQTTVVTENEFYGMSNDKYIKASSPYLESQANPVYTSYNYDSFGRLAVVTAANGKKETFEYNPKYTTKIDALGNREITRIDSRERTVKKENYDSLNLLSSVSYENQPLRQIITDADSSVFVFEYDTLGRLVDQNDPGLGHYSFKYDPNGNLIEKIDPKNQKINYDYDALNRQIRQYSSIELNHCENPGHDDHEEGHGNNSNHDDDEDDNEEHIHNYNNYANHSLSDRLTGQNQSYHDDDEEHDNGNHYGQMDCHYTETITYLYDDTSLSNSIGRLSQVTDLSGISRFSYDEVGNVSGMTKTIGQNTYSFSAQYNSENKVTQISYPDGSSISNHYTDAGYLRQVRYHEFNDADLDGHALVTYFGPNDLAQLMRVTGNGVRDVITYDFNTFKPTAVQTFAKDESGADVTICDLAYTIDSYGNINSIVNNTNQTASQYFQYDGLNRMTNASGIYGVKNYTYSAGGNLLVKGDKNLFYNDPQRPQSVTSDSVGNEFEYDKNGNTTRQNNQRYYYNANNQLIRSSSVHGNNNDSEFTYNFMGARAIKKDDNHKTVYYFHFLSATSPVYEIQVEENHNHVRQTKYIYGLASELVSQITNDYLNYVSVSRQNDAAAFKMASNQGLNLFSKGSLFLTLWMGFGKNAVFIFYVFSIMILAAAGIYLIYNYAFADQKFNGDFHRLNVVYRAALPFVLLAFIWQFGTGCDSFTDGELPTEAIETDFWSAYLGEIPDNITDISEPAGHEEAEHGGYPVSGAYFFHSDHQGSINFVTNAAGQLITEINYLPYGEIDRAHSYGPDILRYKYTHQEEDRESGEYNFNARMYNSDLGRFTSADSIIPEEGKHSQSFNRYMYTMGNPVKYTDPTGHCVNKKITEPLLCTVFGGEDIQHNYTGASQQEGNPPCVTGIDCISKGHDAAGATLVPEFSMAGMDPANSVSYLLGNVILNILWSVVGLSFIVTDFYFGFSAASDWVSTWTWGDFEEGSFGNIFFTALLGLFFTAAYLIYDAVVWVIGTALFLITGFFSLIWAGMAALGGFLNNLIDLIIGRKSLEEIWTEFTDGVDEVWDDIEDFFNGLF